MNAGPETTTPSPAEVLFGRMSSFVAANLPPQISRGYFDGFLTRNRAQLITILAQQLLARGGGAAPAALPTEVPADLWTPAQRTAANIKAMQIAARAGAGPLSAADRAALADYSGWGGLSIEAARDRLPEGFPVPEARGLIHEYYTPTAVAREVARVIRPLVLDLPRVDGAVLALEPSAGIGRFIQAASGEGFEDLRWHAVEWSALSARMLGALRPDVDLTEGPFELWVRERGPALAGRLGLVLSNPPYGQRGAAVTEDPDRSYREKAAYAYFLRRGLDLLAPGGLGVFLVPSGFLTGRGSALVALREKVLLRHHLGAAFRLPSGIFPGANLVTDLLFFRARPGELGAVDPGDQFVAAGDYFRRFPENILGVESGDDQGEDDQTKRARWGYTVEGSFERLPALVERPMCEACEIVREVVVFPGAGARSGKGAVARQLEQATVGLSEHAASAVALGLRVDRYLAAVAADASDEHVQLWPELHEALRSWANTHGNPWASPDLRTLADGGNTGAERFLTAFGRTGKLIDGLAQAPVWTPRFTGRPDDVLALAEWIYRTQRTCTVTALGEALPAGGRKAALDRLPELLDAGWCLDGEGWEELVPAAAYLTGNLWPKLDRADLAIRAGKDPHPSTPLARIEEQARKLREALQPAVLDDIEGVLARQGWMPLHLVAQWLTETLNAHFGPVSLVRKDGLVQLEDVDYDELEDARGLSSEARWAIGWINHDRTTFKPKKAKDENIDEVRLAKAKEWDQSFRAWVATDEARRSLVEEAYNRHFRGFLAPSYPAEPLPIARWAKDGVRLHPHQVAGGRRILANRGGLLAFDVGVGKTYTGIAVLARARQEGWSRRPVILVPNSIVWKWEADIKRVLPDYRVAVVGSKKKIVQRGDRKGLLTSDTDTPAERAEKWTRFQAGEFDVVLLTYTALARTRMNERAIRAYADQTEAIQREVRLRQRNAREGKGLTERQEAILREGVSAWIAEQMELPEGWEYDPGVAWDDVGVDLLIVDEAQNFKNLYLPEPREGGVPRFMGNAGDGSKRAWQLDFRCAAVRRKTGGAGVVLLSATPAKNSPLEFYNLIQYVDHDAWSRMGIRDPEQFIDRYLRIELKPVVDTKMEVVERSAVTGFQNLHELRDVIFRYGDFKTAEDVGLKLPEPRVNVVEVDMNALQEAKYEHYVGEIEKALEAAGRGRSDDAGKVLGLLARMALVAVHPELDEGHDWKTAASSGVDPVSPKFAAMARRVLANRSCGHIVFVDNVAAHRWVVQTLVKVGIPEDRIAVLNAITAKAAADRQRIAKEFNGEPELGEEPKYDVVIANAIAYEGIDLQTRTCAIHHLDLPWEPATLQQRNGRGVRQGNTLANIEINYYFARRSQDGLRFNLIQGKLGWMTELLKSQSRATNNPGAQMDMGPDEILLLISRDPEKTARRLADVRARREADARKKVAEDAARMLRAAQARFRKAERAADPAEAARLRQEGEERLKDLATVDPEAWPWARWMYAARETELLVPHDGAAPVYEGLRVGVPSPWDPSRVELAEFGRVKGAAIGVRPAGGAAWTPRELDALAQMKLQPEHLDAVFPAGEDVESLEAVERRVEEGMRYGVDWPRLGWSWASDAWLERVWPKVGDVIIRGLSLAQRWSADQQHVPVVVRGALVIARGAALGRVDAWFAPTLDGWRRFLSLAPASGLKFGELEAAGLYWWDRRIPRDLLAAVRDEAAPAALAAR
ncbi:MAG: DEAD/DEAH box helicase family protein [Deltaproteobacteria bacterium]|nr:DEAD/DEAH box helicase family protein [Deltaproteobacteria bacterium]